MSWFVVVRSELCGGLMCMVCGQNVVVRGGYLVVRSGSWWFNVMVCGGS